ncbi:MAG: 4-hydroxy-tetrahydrodipicolinate reductase [Promethearchaeota archaeon]
MAKVKVFILGIDGSMGRINARLAVEDPDLEVVGGTTIDGAPTIGTDVGTLVGKPPLGVKVSPVSDLETLLDSLNPDVVVDFTVAEATELAAPLVLGRGIKYVVGTTMLSGDCLRAIEDGVKGSGTAAVVSSNMAVGVNVVFKVAAQLARVFSDWDVEIIEAHHHRKRDAPSGTANTIAREISKALGVDLEKVAKYGRPKGPAPRVVGSGEIGIHAVRAGDIVGDHTVLYAGPGERIELTHRAHSRECFGAGTMRAIHFLAEGAAPGKVYSMADVLGLD